VPVHITVLLRRLDSVIRCQVNCFGGRPVVRPRNRWEDVIHRDAANLLRNWEAAARDKEEWTKKVGEAMAQKRAEAPQKN
jgi:hypothetical protein